MGKWFKILTAALVVAPELIQAGKQVVSAAKGVAKGNVPADPPKLGDSQPVSN